jgi:hypothetical protein
MQNGLEGALWSAADIDLFVRGSLGGMEEAQPTHGHNGDSRTSAVKQTSQLQLC